MLFEKMTSKIQGMNRVFLLSEFLEEVIVITALCRNIFKELKPYITLNKASTTKEKGVDDKGKKGEGNKGHQQGNKSKTMNSSTVDRSGPSTTRKVHIDDNRVKDEAPMCDTGGGGIITTPGLQRRKACAASLNIRTLI